MLPPAAAEKLRQHGHDAVSVLDVGMSAVEDAEVFDRAATEGRVVVTENFADFARLLQERQGAGKPTAPVVFVRRDDLPPRGAMAVHLAQRLHAWASEQQDPPAGLYWLK